MHRILALVMVVCCLIAPLAAAQSSPELVVSAPAAGATINGTDVTINFQVSGLTLVPSNVPLNEAGKRPESNRPGEGHLHFVLDLQPLVVWDRNAPYTFNNIPPGEHQLMVELVNNDHSPLAPQVMKQISFRTAVMMPSTGPQSGWTSVAARSLWGLVALSLLGAGWLLRRQYRPLLSDPLRRLRDK